MRRTGLTSLSATAVCATTLVLATSGTVSGHDGGDSGPQAQPGGAVLITPAPVLGDVNRDCVVNTLDLTVVLGKWGTSDPDADLNRDGVVNGPDQQIVLASWGSTCGRRLHGDANGDGIVSTPDLVKVLGDWNTGAPQSDINDDGTVGQGDVDLVLANWGRTLGRRLLGDFNGDDAVDILDLVAILGSWGQNAPTLPSLGGDNVGPLELDVVLARWAHTSGTELLGDVNGDKLVDGRDSDLVLAFWGSNRRQADLDGNGAVGQTDLNIVLVNWGETSSDELLGDVNGDWVVDDADSALILATWGDDDPRYDINDDGTINIVDLNLVLVSWGEVFARQFPGDVDGSCVVDGADVDLVEAFWGTSFRPADIDDDGVVGFLDLLIVITNFGNTCP